MIKIITAPDSELIHKIYTLYNNELPRYTAKFNHFCERLMLYNGSTVLIEEENDQLLGFAIVYRDGLLMLLVNSDCRRQGIGSRLLADCERIAKPYNRLILGHGSSGRYLFYGALVTSDKFPPDYPDEHDELSIFLDKRGYTDNWTAADCLLELSEFHPRQNECRGFCEIRTRRDNERDAAFKLGNLVSHWGENYRDANELIGAYLPDGKLIGGVIFEDGCMFGESIAECCTLGCLGVDPEYRCRGIAASLCHTLASRAIERGYKRVFIGYTHIYDWYAGLGSKVYAYYRMGEKKL